MAQVDPNPQTNPAMELQCANCLGMYREYQRTGKRVDELATGINSKLTPYPGYPAPPPTWIWHTPAGGGPNDFGTEVGGFDDYDSENKFEINIKHPHCPHCGSHAVNIIRSIEPDTMY